MASSSQQPQSQPAATAQQALDGILQQTSLDKPPHYQHLEIKKWLNQHLDVETELHFHARSMRSTGHIDKIQQESLKLKSFLLDINDLVVRVLHEKGRNVQELIGRRQIDTDSIFQLLKEALCVNSNESELGQAQLPYTPQMVQLESSQKGKALNIQAPLNLSTSEDAQNQGNSSASHYYDAVSFTSSKRQNNQVAAQYKNKPYDFEKGTVAASSNYEDRKDRNEPKQDNETTMPSNLRCETIFSKVPSSTQDASLDSFFCDSERENEVSSKNLRYPANSGSFIETRGRKVVAHKSESETRLVKPTDSRSDPLDDVGQWRSRTESQELNMRSSDKDAQAVRSKSCSTPPPMRSQRSRSRCSTCSSTSSTPPKSQIFSSQDEIKRFASNSNQLRDQYGIVDRSSQLDGEVSLSPLRQEASETHYSSHGPVAGANGQSSETYHQRLLQQYWVRDNRNQAQEQAASSKLSPTSSFISSSAYSKPAGIAAREDQASNKYSFPAQKEGISSSHSIPHSQSCSLHEQSITQYSTARELDSRDWNSNQSMRSEPDSHNSPVSQRQLNSSVVDKSTSYIRSTTHVETQTVENIDHIRHQILAQQENLQAENENHRLAAEAAESRYKQALKTLNKMAEDAERTTQEWKYKLEQARKEHELERTRLKEQLQLLTNRGTELEEEVQMLSFKLTSEAEKTTQLQDRERNLSDRLQQALDSVKEQENQRQLDYAKLEECSMLQSKRAEDEHHMQQKLQHQLEQSNQQLKALTIKNQTLYESKQQIATELHTRKDEVAQLELQVSKVQEAAIIAQQCYKCQYECQEKAEQKLTEKNKQLKHQLAELNKMIPVIQREANDALQAANQRYLAEKDKMTMQIESLYTQIKAAADDKLQTETQIADVENLRDQIKVLVKEKQVLAAEIGAMSMRMRGSENLIAQLKSQLQQIDGAKTLERDLLLNKTQELDDALQKLALLQNKLTELEQSAASRDQLLQEALAQIGNVIIKQGAISNETNTNMIDMAAVREALEKIERSVTNPVTLRCRVTSLQDKSAAPTINLNNNSP